MGLSVVELIYAVFCKDFIEKMLFSFKKKVGSYEVELHYTSPKNCCNFTCMGLHVSTEKSHKTYRSIRAKKVETLNQSNL